MTESEIPVTDELRSQPRLVLTNQRNLREMLSTGMLLTLEGFEKYYPDAFELTPGRIPVFTSKLPANLVSRVAREPGVTPVALVLRQEQPWGGDGSSGAVLMAGPLPLASAVETAVFVEQQDLQNFLETPFDNLDVRALTTSVDPDLFTANDVSPEDLTRLSDEIGVAAKPSVTDYRVADKEAGSRALVAAMVDGDGTTFDGLVEFVAPSGRVPKDLGKLPRWLYTGPHWSVVTKPTLDQRIYMAAIDRLSSEDVQESWRPVEVLERISIAIDRTALSKTQHKELDSNLNGLRLIVSNERPFKPFRERRGLPVAKALLLVLLRPDPERLLDWNPSDSGASADVMFTAAALVGRLRGRRRMPLSLRPAPFDHFLAHQTACQVNGAGLRPEDRPRVVVDHDTRRIVWRDRDLLKATATAIDPKGSVEEKPDQRIMLEICKELGWDDCCTTSFNMPASEIDMTIAGGTVQLRLRGLAMGQVAVDTNRFAERLSSGELDPALEAHVRAKLAGGAAEPANTPPIVKA